MDSSNASNPGKSPAVGAQSKLVSRQLGQCLKQGTLLLVWLACSFAPVREANAYLIADFGFTNLVKPGTNLKASVHSVLNFDTVFAPQKYEYVYQVTNTGGDFIETFGVFGGTRANITTPICGVPAQPLANPPVNVACTPANLPSWLSNLAFPDPAWMITVASDGNANPSNYGVKWHKVNGLAVNKTLTFMVASVNPPIVGGAFIDPIAESSGFYVEDAAGSIAEATYGAPEPASLLLLVGGFLGARLVRGRRAPVSCPRVA